MSEVEVLVDEVDVAVELAVVDNAVVHQLNPTPLARDRLTSASTNNTQ